MGWAAGLLAALLGLMGAGAVLVHSEPGTRWLLRQLPGVQELDSRGGLLSPTFHLKHLRVVWGNRGAQAVVEGLRWESPQALWLPRTGTWLSLRWQAVFVEQVTVDTGAPSDTPPPALSTLRLPLDLAIDTLQVQRVKLGPSLELRGLKAQLALGDTAGALHRLAVHDVQLVSGGNTLRVEGQASIGADAPLNLSAAFMAQGEAGPWPWNAQVQARGPLASFDTRLQLKSLAPVAAGAAPPTLDANAQVRPFERWPLGDVSATTHALDLSSILAGAPRTRLSGHVVVRSQGLREPVSADIEIDNAAAAQLDAGGLPLLSLRARVQADPRQPQRLTIGPFDVQAADAQGGAGRWTGTGLWDGPVLRIDSRVSDIQPARLDGRLAAMRLSGPLRLTVEGLPSPGQASSASTTGAAAGVSAELDAQLEGTVSGLAQGVGLTFTAQANRQRLAITTLKASSGRARLALQAQLSRLDAAKAGSTDGPLWQVGQRWRLTSEGTLDAFNPAEWFPGHAALRASDGAHQLNGHWALDVTAPVPATPVPWTRWLPQWQGQADARLLESRWAGKRLSGELQLRQAESGSEPRSRVTADVRLAGNQLTLDGRADPLSDGQTDHTQLTVDAPALGEIGALLKGLGAAEAYAPRQGSLRGKAELRGRWPAIRAELQTQVDALQAGQASLERATVQARWDRPSQDSVQVRAELAGLQWAQASLQLARLTLDGTAATHRFDAELQAPVQAPPALAAALGWQTGAAARTRLQGQGRWQAQGDGSAGWRFSVDELSAGALTAPANAPRDSSWLRAVGVTGELGWSPEGGLASAMLAPGRLDSGEAAIVWTEARWWRQGAGPARFALRGNLEPLPIAAALNRLAPVMAKAPSTTAPVWAGDLRVGARVDIRATPALEADVLLQRTGGDLLLRDGTNELALGIDQASLELQARQAVWRWVPRLRGKTLGTLDGELTLRTSGAEAWPDAASALGGRVKAEVGTLAAWGAWLPPGWRLQGQAQAEAQLGGTLSAPLLTGHVQAQRVALRNALQGVDFTEGDLRIALDGETARVERATVRGGTGTLSIDGQARLGAQPQFRLTARAEKLRVLGRIDRQLTLSGQLGMTGQASRLQVDGKITADSGLFDLSQRDAPSLDDDVDVRRAGQADTEDLPKREPGTLARQLQLAVDLDLGRQLRLRGRGLDTLLQGSLKLSAPAGRFAVQGQVKAVDGTYAAYGQKLGIERGVVSFEGPLDRTRLDILALRPNLDVRVGVAITGNAQEPRVRLFSEPDLPESDKLSWLVLGRGPEGLGRTDTALLQRAAMALLAGEGQGPADGLLRRLGIDDFAIRQSDGEVRETVVSVGKQLSRRWYVGYERGVNAASGTWQLVYRIAQRFTLRAQSGDDNSLDVIWTWRFATQAQRRESGETR